jgi:hypothetical protein
MKSCVLILALLARPCLAEALNVPLTVQEALYPGGTAGVVRTNEPFCMGVPIADSAAIANSNSLTLTGATAGQFRILGNWPSGNAKWVQVCGILANLNAGGTATVTLTNGSGNFGGTPLAADSGATITVTTGAAAFTIKKANFNILESVVIGGTTLLAPSSAATRGLMISGPNPVAAYPANVTCGSGAGQSPCDQTNGTLYASANDAASSCSIEENGPVTAVIRCIGNFMDATGHPYMHYTVRERFYAGKSSVKLVTVMRNADYNTSANPSPDMIVNGNPAGTFNTAFKGMQSYEVRINPSLSGNLIYKIGCDPNDRLCTSGVASGTLTTSDSAYIYQGQADRLNIAGYGCDYQSPCANQYTPDTGYIAKKNTTTIASGDHTTSPSGWADISDATGNGVQIGMDEFAAQWPASLEFNNGGTDVRVGMWSNKNSSPLYMPWPGWQIRECWLNFHTSAPASLANDFLKYQHYLLARPSTISYINSTNVFPYPLPDPATEDAFYVSTANTSSPRISLDKFCFNNLTNNCTPDRGTVSPAYPLGVWRNYPWFGGGGSNQEDFRWSDLWRFMQRGQTGRWLNSAHFYRYVSDKYFWHSDGQSPTDSRVNSFKWSDRPGVWASMESPTKTPELDSLGVPYVMFHSAFPVANQSQATNISAPDLDHDHWYGMIDYYFMTGDELFKESILARKSHYLNLETVQAYAYGTRNLGTSYFYPGYGQFTPANTRGAGIEMMAGSRMYEFLNAIGDSDAAGVMTQAQLTFDYFVNNQGCLSGFPMGCTPPPVASPDTAPHGDPYAMSFERGLFQSDRNVNGWCSNASGSGVESGLKGNYRIVLSFQQSILIEGILSLRRAQGPTWNGYNRALDLAFGLGMGTLLENFMDDGSGRYCNDPPGAFPNASFPGSGRCPATTGNNSLYNGFRYNTVIDDLSGNHTFGQQCPASTTLSPNIIVAGGNKYDGETVAGGAEGSWFPWYVKYLMTGDTSWVQQVQMTMQWDGAGGSNDDFGSYQINSLIAAQNNPSGLHLQDVAFSLMNNGNGSYTLNWTTPIGTCTNDPSCLRVKWSPRIIQSDLTKLLQFDNMVTNTFGIDPTYNQTWFSANNVWPEPTPVPGTQQSITITNTGSTTLTAGNFSVKAMSPPVATGPPANLVSISGNGQTGAPGQALAFPFVVEVTDAAGHPVSGVNVTFAVTSSGGALSAAIVPTNGQGLASTILTLGVSSGINTVTASSGSLSGSPITFTATATSAPGPASLVMVSGNAQTGLPGQPLTAPFAVKVTDASGAPVAGVSVTFAVVAGNGTLSAAQVATNSQGLALTTLTLGLLPGVNTVTATSGTLAGSPVTFNATAMASTATNLLLVSGNSQSAVPGQQPTYPLAVKATDAAGNPVSGVAVTFAVTAGGGSVNPTSIATDAQGMAATTLTVGPTPGVNTVTATAGTLAGSPVTFTVTGGAGSDQNTITWTKQPSASTLPGWNGWISLPYDPVSFQTLVYSTHGGIYSGWMTAYNSTTNAFTTISDDGVTSDVCVPDLPNNPGNRHPVGQMAIDTKRNLLWTFSGVNQNCGENTVDVNGTQVTNLNGLSTTWLFPTGGQLVGQTVLLYDTIKQSTIGTFVVASVQDSTHLTLAKDAGVHSNLTLYVTSGSEASPRQDMYYLTLHADPTQDVWYQVMMRHFPPGMGAAGALVYDSDDDVLFMLGPAGSNVHVNWRYCPTVLTSTPGILSAVQITAGCTVADDWTEDTVVGGVQPTHISFPIMLYDPATKNVIHYQDETWAYNIPSKTWTKKCRNGCVNPPAYTGGAGVPQPAIIYNTVDHMIYYHQTSNTGAPADWRYDPVADTWTRLTTVGTGPTGADSNFVLYMAYDIKTNSLITYSQPGTLIPEMWIGQLAALNISPGACDLNADHLVNVLDVQIANNQALGITPCGSADLNGDGTCNQSDIQRIINASLGGACLTGR